MALPADPVGRALVQMLARDRYERWLHGEIETLLESGFKDVAGKLLTDFSDLKGGQQARRARLFQQINRQLAVTYGQADVFLQGQMKQYAGIEARAAVAHVKALVAASPTIDITLENLTRAEVKAIAEFPIAGLGIGDWFEKQASDMNAATRGQIQLGLLNGETSNQIARRILPTKEQIPGIIPVGNRSKHAARTLVRTTVTTVQTQASFETMKDIDPKLVEKFRFVAVRDARTTPICRALDGKVFAFNDPKAKRPPQHPNCRSTIVAEVNYAYLGIPKPNSIKDGLTAGSYDDWLRSRPTAEQDDILGKAGAQLFRDRRASLMDLVNTDGRRMTIDALAQKYSTTTPLEREQIRVVPEPKPEPKPEPPKPAARTFNPEPMRAFEEEIAQLPIEHAAVYDGTGKEMFRQTSNKPTYVQFTLSQAYKMRKAKNAVMTHNHPRSLPFSPADISLAIGNDLAEVRAVGKKAAYSMRRPEGGWGLNHWEVEALWKAAAEQARKEINALYAADLSLATGQYEALVMDRMWAIVAKKHGWIYTKLK